MTFCDEFLKQRPYRQAKAIDLLAAGHSITDTARVIGVTRQTVSRWLNQDPVFADAVVYRRLELRLELWQAATQYHQKVMVRAMSFLESALTGRRSKRKIETAIAILNSLS